MKHHLHAIVNLVFAVLAVVGVVCSLLVGDFPTDWTKRLRGSIVAIWLLGPPIYFYIEWVFLYKESDEYPLEKFKYSQGLARNIWLAVTAILVALYFNGFDFGK